jgi:hypothetical protein
MRGVSPQITVDLVHENHRLKKQVAKLKARIAEYVEQAEQGIWVEHQCPAFFACGFIVADNEGRKPQSNRERQSSTEP